MGIQKIGDTDPSKKLSTLGNAAYKRPYLLRHLTINHPNQVWSVDITYIPMQKGFMYLTAIIDIYSRCIVGWGLHNNLDKENCLEVISEAIARHGAPEVINSDQGCQFTSKLWIETCENHGIKIRMTTSKS